VDDADDAGAADAGDDVITAERPELFGDKGGRVVNIEQQFRIGVKATAPSGDFILHGDNVINELHNLSSVAVFPGPARAVRFQSKPRIVFCLLTAI
jgi:hypothetical protein